MARIGDAELGPNPSFLRFQPLNFGKVNFWNTLACCKLQVTNCYCSYHALLVFFLVARKLTNRAWFSSFFFPQYDSLIWCFWRECWRFGEFCTKSLFCGKNHPRFDIFDEASFFSAGPSRKSRNQTWPKLWKGLKKGGLNFVFWKSCLL